MTKDELVSKIADKSNLSKKVVNEFVAAFIEEITEAMKNGKRVSFVGFGTFEPKLRKERQGINPQTKEKITIPARRVPVFKAGKKLREAVK